MPPHWRWSVVAAEQAAFEYDRPLNDYDYYCWPAAVRSSVRPDVVAVPVAAAPAGPVERRREAVLDERLSFVGTDSQSLVRVEEQLKNSSLFENNEKNRIRSKLKKKKNNSKKQKMT